MSFRRLHDLSQHAAHRGRVDEGYAGVSDPHPWRLVDQAQPGVAQARQLGLDVLHGVGDVVEPGPSLGQVAADRRLGPEGRQQFHVAVAHVEQRRVHSLLLNGLAVGERHSEDVAVDGQGVVHVRYGNSHMVDPAEHSAAEHTGPAPGWADPGAASY